MKIFISQPMKGKTQEQIETERNKAIKEIKRMVDSDVEIIDSFFKDIDLEKPPLWYLGESIKLLSSADYIYLCDNWVKSRGCVIEYLCALSYNIKILKY